MNFRERLQKALDDGIVKLSNKILFDYEEINPVYRGIKYNDNKQTVEESDFDSQIERNLPGFDNAVLSNYGCSFFTDLDEFHEIVKFPKRGRAVAKGKLMKEYGPCMWEGADSHVMCFLYDGVLLSEEFEVIEHV